MFSRRESKRRALLKLLERIPLRAKQAGRSQPLPIVGKVDVPPGQQPLPKQG